jgi:hypothetical protein
MSSDNQLTSIRKKPLLPKQWRAFPEPLVDGILAVGYGKNSDFLLVVFDDGLAVYNVTTGKRVAREYSLTESLDDSYYDFETNLAPGIGPLEGQLIQLAGPYGGKLKEHTKDGWTLSLTPKVNNIQRIMLSLPRTGHTVPAAEILDGPFAYGFSETGRSFVIVNQNTLLLFGKVKDTK